MKSSGIHTNSCRFDTQIRGLNQGAHNMTHSIAGSPLWDPNSPEALSSVVSLGVDKKESYQFYSRIYILPIFVGSLEQFNLPSFTSSGIALPCIWLTQKKNTFVCFLPDLHGRSAPPNLGQNNDVRARLVSSLQPRSKNVRHP